MLFFPLIFCLLWMKSSLLHLPQSYGQFLEKMSLNNSYETKISISSQLFESDIRLTRRQAAKIVQTTKTASKRRRRKLTESMTKRWRLPIAYAFDGSHNVSERRVIVSAIQYWQELTCITFVEKAHVTPKLLFVKQNGCWSHVGFTRQQNQTISIDAECQSNGTIAHEVGHAIGFWHEQSRPDRSQFLNIHPENIIPEKMRNFQTRSWADILVYGLPYDLGSAMHYGSRYYTKDENASLATLESRDRLMQMVMGQRQELSFYDVKLANMAYCDKECSGKGVKLVRPCKRDGYQDPNKCDQCLCPDGFSGMFCEILLPPVNAICGGIIDASAGGTITSPGYRYAGYNTNTKCTWLLKAPQFYNVYLEFIEDFGLSCETEVCKDFVEVRYNSSLSITGARFCCLKKPKVVLKSGTNELLLLMRTFSKDAKNCTRFPWKCIHSNVGFKALYYIKPCGGGPGPKRQPSCVRRISYNCPQIWTEGGKKLCPDWWHAKSCESKTTNKSRNSTCFKDERFCNSPYQLGLNHKRCIRNNSKKSSNSTVQNKNKTLQILIKENQ